MILVVTTRGLAAVEDIRGQFSEKITVANASGRQIYPPKERADSYSSMDTVPAIRSQRRVFDAINARVPLHGRRIRSAIGAKIPQRWTTTLAEWRDISLRLKPPKAASRGTSPESRRADRLLELVDAIGAQVVVAAEEHAAGAVYGVSQRRPELLALAGPTVAASLLGELDLRGWPRTADDARRLLDPDFPGRPRSSEFPIRYRPRVVQVVGNAVRGDSRVQKVAASLHRAGCESILLGMHDDEPHDFIMDGAVVRLLTRDRAATDWERESPPRLPQYLLAFRSAHEMAAARVKVKAKSMSSVEPDSATPTLSELRTHAEDAARRRAVAARIVAHRRNRAAFFAPDIDIRDQQQGIRAERSHKTRVGDFALVWDIQATFGAEVERLKPDVIHAHDAETLLVAKNAARRLRATGHPVRIVYDAHEYVPGTLRAHSMQRTVSMDLERRYAPLCDAVITVSDQIADLLFRELRLSRRPSVVENAPDMRSAPDVTGIRELIGLSEETPLVVYVGGVAKHRGVDVAVHALRNLPGVHLAVVAPESHQTRGLEVLADEVGVRDRLHRVDYVAHAAVPKFIEAADLGLISWRRLSNHEVGLPTKFREYICAGLPIVASDVGLVANAVKDLGVGQTFQDGDSEDLARKIESVLKQSHVYRSRLTDTLKSQFGWASQEARLNGLYAELVVLKRDAPRERDEARRCDPVPADAIRPSRVLIGPRNTAGQANAWAQSLRAAGVTATGYQIIREDSPWTFSADILLLPERLRDPEFRLSVLQELVGSHTHALMDIGAQFLALTDPSGAGPRVLTDSGVVVALVGHGSEIRRPQRHAEREKWSPFSDPTHCRLTDQLHRATAKNHRMLADFDGPVFVSTPDLLDDLPFGNWLPVVVDTSLFRDRESVDAVRAKPVVLHAPSSDGLKGSRFIDPVLAGLHREGVIRYHRVRNVAHAMMPGLLAESDIVVDQVLMNLIGVGAAEAMACGRVCVAHIDDRLAERFPRRPPVVDATPDTLEEVVRQLAADRARRAELGRLGRDFALEVHDGRMSAKVLADGLGIDLADVTRQGGDHG